MIRPPAPLSTIFRDLVNRFRADIPALRRTGRYALLPELCVNCLGKDARQGLCSGCRSDLPINHTCCHRCGLPLILAMPRPGLICGECLKHPPAYDRAFMPWRYEFPVDRMISHYKYHRQRAFGRPLLADMAGHVEAYLAACPDQRPDLLVPAPMHRQRERQRGFNQAAEIAEAISQRTGIPWSGQRVRRVRKSAAQSGLDRQERLRNLRGVFEVNGEVPAHLAIVDDVVTTGATMRTLAWLLRKHGAERIQVWALARTPAHSGHQGFYMTGNGETGRESG
ncbi:comF family protein [Marinobacter daqiaonensis]|uniref:ComF family protein n=1 Tax=Marinobacter daqiaonensis TaxID=650891 RepID=A0A1I6HDD0_9GAMM|nr:ComF family protein [Marinobacter daqiaonensis]SFR52368.1 comF family protein [Marinobacter daqiaonensis]